MKFSVFLAALSAGSALSAPLKRQYTPTDIDILQYALTLEHLENAFYTEALYKFDAAAFANAGFPDWVRGRYQQIADHEATHVSLLAAALGDIATKPCTYSFPYNDPKSFAALSNILEGVGTSAYLGAAGFITDPRYLAIAGAILTTEARHAAWINSQALSDTPWSGAFDVGLGLNYVFSLAAPFITSCPDTNPTLPVKAFPTLSVSPATPTPGSTITLQFDDSSANGAPLYLAFFSGLDTTFVPIHNKQVTIPANLWGTVYAVVTKSGTEANDATTVAGPTIFKFPIPADARMVTTY